MCRIFYEVSLHAYLAQAEVLIGSNQFIAALQHLLVYIQAGVHTLQEQIRKMLTGLLGAKSCNTFHVVLHPLKTCNLLHVLMWPVPLIMHRAASRRFDSASS